MLWRIIDSLEQKATIRKIPGYTLETADLMNIKYKSYQSINFFFSLSFLVLCYYVMLHIPTCVCVFIVIVLCKVLQLSDSSPVH